MLPRLALACSCFALLLAAPALGATYNVAGFADEPGTPGSCTPSGGGFSCPSLRAAVMDSNQAPGGDVVALQPGIYPVNQGQMSITDALTISGAGARATTLQGSGNGVLSVESVATVAIGGVTVAGGDTSDSPGGNIRNSGVLTISDSRVTGGAAIRGAGIANLGGRLTVVRSLIDGNHADLTGGTGGGIYTTSAFGSVPIPAVTEIHDSTLAGNTATNGGGVATEANPGGSTELIHATIAHNDGGGLYLGPSQSAGVYGSILALNTPGNCTGVMPVTDRGADIDDGGTCAFTGAGSRSATDPQLSGALADEGGPTNVFSVPQTSPAVGLVADCRSTLDQRGVARGASALEPCDAGAFEYVAPVEPPPPPVPTPTAAPPAPTPTPAPEATPVAQRSVAGKPVSGTVLVRAPNGKFVPLDPTKPIPLGSTIDVKDGVIELSAIVEKGGKVQHARFYDGVFKVTQTKTTTDLTLNEALAKCAKSASAAAKKKPKSRKLWGDGSGSFRTRGQYSSATVRGTKWLVEDSCSGTLTRVSKGTVNVRDEVKRRTIIVRGGKKYLARPKRSG